MCPANRSWEGTDSFPRRNEKNMSPEWIALACAALLVGSPSLAGLSLPQPAEDFSASGLASEDEGDDDTDDDDTGDDDTDDDDTEDGEGDDDEDEEE
jgi:hypothetical protein